jgi:CspA family cold shock protein
MALQYIRTKEHASNYAPITIDSGNLSNNKMEIIMRRILLIYSFIISVTVACILPYILQSVLDINLAGQYPLAAGLTFAMVWVSCLLTGVKFITTEVDQVSDYDNLNDREFGVVKWFNVTKGFGFITRDAGGDVFVHFRSIRGQGRRSLKECQRVSFTVTESNKGIQAEDINVI